MTDIPRPAPGDTDWLDWADDEEAMSDRVRNELTGKVTAVTANAKLWIGTQAAYDALATKDATTVYAIT